MAERLAAGSTWQNTGLVVTNTRGRLLRRSNVDGRDLARVIRKARQKVAEAYEKQGMSCSEAHAKAAKLLEGITLHARPGREGGGRHGAVRREVWCVRLHSGRF